jgi:hypothetical protein
MPETRTDGKDALREALAQLAVELEAESGVRFLDLKSEADQERLAGILESLLVEDPLTRLVREGWAQCDDPGALAAWLKAHGVAVVSDDDIKAAVETAMEPLRPLFEGLG